jgi:hypothetical protein
MSNELFKTIEAQGRLITELRAELESRANVVDPRSKVYAVHVMDSLLDYSEQKLFTEYANALQEYQRAVKEAKRDEGRIKEIYSESDIHLYYEGDESSVKIFIEELIINQ